MQFVDLVALERHNSRVHVRSFVDVDDLLDNLVHSEMELVAEQQLAVFDIHETPFQVFPYYQLSIELHLGPAVVVLVALSLAVDQLDLVVLVFAGNDRDFELFNRTYSTVNT